MAKVTLNESNVKTLISTLVEKQDIKSLFSLVRIFDIAQTENKSRVVVFKGIKDKYEIPKSDDPTLNNAFVNEIKERVNSSDSKGMTMLHIAAFQNEPKLVKKLCTEYAANVNYRNFNGSTPLCVASAKNSIKSVEALLENNADCKVKNKRGVTPLHLAARNGNTKIAELITKKDPETVNIKDKSGNVATFPASTIKTIALGISAIVWAPIAFFFVGIKGVIDVFKDKTVKETFQKENISSSNVQMVEIKGKGESASKDHTLEPISKSLQNDPKFAESANKAAETVRDASKNLKDPTNQSLPEKTKETGRQL